MDSFGCETDPGSMIHAIEKPPNEYHCPEMVDSWHSEWTLNENTKSCYLFRQGYAAYHMQSLTKRENL